MLTVVMLSVAFSYCYAERRYAEFRYAECRHSCSYNTKRDAANCNSSKINHAGS